MVQTLTISSRPTEPLGYTPFIRMSGQYLEENGFCVGDKVKMEISPNEIRITKEKPNEPIIVCKSNQ